MPSTQPGPPKRPPEKLMSHPTIAVLGATGKLGTAVAHCWGRDSLIGLARRPPADAPAWSGFVAADRQDVAALAETLAGADAVVDLCGFTAADAEALVQAARVSGRADLRLVAASSVAERPLSHWSEPELASSPLPEDAYGLGKRQYTEFLLQNWPGPVLCVMLPNLIQVDPVDPRLQQWWREARTTGVIRIPGSGQQRVALLPIDVAADLVVRLVPLHAITGRLAVACPQPPTVAGLATALFGAMTPMPAQQLGAAAGLFSGGPELLALGALKAALPDFAWPDLTTLFAELGGRMARDRPES